MADTTNPKCTCAHCRARGLMGPIMLITIGALFLLGEYTRYGFWKLWPVILVVAGIVLCAQSFASRAGHTGS
jgi:Domain of unknown function (DUF5668)